MRYKRISRGRRGSVLPFAAVCLVSLVGFLALSIDLGVLQVARTQCQNAADTAALSGARRLTGDSSNDHNKALAPTAAKNAAAGNSVLGTAVNPNTQVTVTVGSYRYDSGQDKFIIDPDNKGASDAWSLVRATVAAEHTSFFAPVLGLKIGNPPAGGGGSISAGGSISGGPVPPAPAPDLGLGTLKVGAIATSAHRPRDIAIIVDFSGSMHYGSLLGGPLTNSSGVITNRTQALNPETVYPTFGQYSLSLPTWRGATTPIPTILATAGELMDLSNAVTTTGGGTPMIDGFYKDAAAFGSSTKAFQSQPTSYASTPSGDIPKYKSGSTTVFAANINEILNRTVNTTSTTTKSTAAPWIDDTTATNTNAGYGSSFSGYTVGPNYWGKTFFIWPPDPRKATDTTSGGHIADNGAKDWRQRFFTKIFLGQRTTTSTSTSTSSGSGSSGSSSSSSSSTSSTSAPPPPPPPPPANIRDGRAFFNVTGTAAAAVAAEALNQVTLPAVGEQSPLDINAIMFNGNYDLTTGTTAATYGNGTLIAPGNPVSFKVYDVSVTSGGLTTRTRKYVDFVYKINYNAILSWLKNSGSNPFPTVLRSGGILYYDQIPNDIDTSVNPATPTSAARTYPQPTSTQAQRNIRFWKEYIDEVLGLQHTGNGSWTNGTTVRYARYSYVGGRTGYKDMFSWNTPNGGTSTNTGIFTSGGAALAPYTVGFSNTLLDAQLADTRSMNYADNPRRPSLQFWFGPMTMLDFISNLNQARNWLPGTVYDAPLWQCKAGVQAAINDIKINHPNDQVTLVAFSTPEGYSPSAPTTLRTGYYNAVRSPLGRDYNKIINSLYFPPKALQTGSEINPYDSGMNDVPRAIGGTCFPMAFMLAYNQFSRGTGDADLRTYATSPAPYGQAGGLGRKGAQKIIIFESDGVCSSLAYQPGNISSFFVDQGSNKSYFKVRYDGAGSIRNEYPNYLAYDPTQPTQPGDQTKEIARRICAYEDAALGGTDAGLGFSSTRKPVRLHTLAFGSLFDPVATPSATTSRNQAFALLQELQTIGRTQTSATTALDPDKVIIGATSTARIDKMSAAFSKILQDGYSVTLIE